MAPRETGKWNLSGTACSQLSTEVASRGSQGVVHISMGCAPNTHPILGGLHPLALDCRDLGLRIAHQARLMPDKLELSFPTRAADRETSPRHRAKKGFLGWVPGPRYLGSWRCAPLCYGLNCVNREFIC